MVANKMEVFYQETKFFMAPSSSGLGHKIFILVTGVQLSMGSLLYKTIQIYLFGDVAQWQEANDLGSFQCGFESLRLYQLKRHFLLVWSKSHI